MQVHLWGWMLALSMLQVIAPGSATVAVFVPCRSDVCRPRFLFEPKAGVCTWPPDSGLHRRYHGDLLQRLDNVAGGTTECYKLCLRDEKCTALNTNGSSCELFQNAVKQPWNTTYHIFSGWQAALRPTCIKSGTESETSTTDVRCSWSEPMRGIYYPGVITRSYEKTSSPQQCIQQCARRVDCASINWNSLTFACDLMKDQATQNNQFTAISFNFTNIYVGKYFCTESPTESIYGSENRLPYSAEAEQMPLPTTDAEVGNCTWGFPYVGVRMKGRRLAKYASMNNRQACLEKCGSNDDCLSINWNPRKSRCELFAKATNATNYETVLEPAKRCDSCSHIEKIDCVADVGRSIAALTAGPNGADILETDTEDHLMNWEGCGRQAPGHEPSIRLDTTPSNLSSIDLVARNIQSAPRRAPKLRIRGGSEAKRGSWPWVVALVENGEVFCGGAVWQNDIVITAAHCFSEEMGIEEVYVVAGDHSQSRLDAGEQSLKVTGLVMHQHYDNRSMANDIALLKLAKPLDFNNFTSAICLPDHQSDGLSSGSACVIAGWGRLDAQGKKADVLQQGVINIVDYQACRTQYDGDVLDSMLCAGHSRGEVDTCKDDSGSPLVCKDDSGVWNLYGITSWGRGGCGSTAWPGVYVNVAKLVGWITDEATKLKIGS